MKSTKVISDDLFLSFLLFFIRPPPPHSPVAKITPVSSQFHNREAARSLEHNQQKGQRETRNPCIKFK
jgi:hypothetical protein